MSRRKRLSAGVQRSNDQRIGKVLDLEPVVVAVLFLVAYRTPRSSPQVRITSRQPVHGFLLKASCLLRESWPRIPCVVCDLGIRGHGSAARGGLGTRPEITSSDAFPCRPYRGREGAGGPSGLPAPLSQAVIAQCPLPVRLTVCGLPLALSEMVSVPVCVPELVG